MAAIAELLDSTDPERREAALKMMCMLRDGNKCALTRDYDIIQFEKLPTQDQAAILATGCMTTYTEAIYIIPFSLGVESLRTVGTYLINTDFYQA